MAGILIIGAGECGVRTAFALRESDYQEKIALIGAEPHLPYERPPLSKTPEAVLKPIAAADRYAAAGIELTLGRTVKAIDPARKRVELHGGEFVSFDKLVLAIGARARLFKGLEAASTLRTLDDAQSIMGTLSGGGKLAIIGGGFIGLELAATARRAGAEVTLIEAAGRLMARAVPADVAKLVENRHRDEGVAFVFNAAVGRCSPTQIDLADGRTIEADLIVAGVGAQPNIELAAATGLTIENGIAVDEMFRTGHRDIHAAGDCCSFPWRGGRVRLESWRAAQDHGNFVAGVIAGRQAPYARAPWFWSDQYDWTLQVAGLPQAGLQTVDRDIGSAVIRFQIAADGSLVAAYGVGPGNSVARDIRLAEMMIERGVRPDPAILRDPDANLKSALRN